MTTTRERLHEMINDVPDDRLDVIEAALADATAPYRQLSETPQGDEPLTAEPLEVIRKGREASARDEYITNDEMKERLGLR